MSVNYSSSSNSSLDYLHHLCFNSKAGYSILIPISIFILHLGVQQWRRQHSFKTASHSDIFTYNIVVMELIWSLGKVLSFLLVVFFGFLNIMIVAFVLASIIFYGETGFHVLTCVDRYLAVVHPVKYRELRNTRGVTIRNIGIFCVWLISFLWTCLAYLGDNTMSTMLFFSFLVPSLAVVSFCSLSVLCALFRPGPGTGGENKGHSDQSKKRAVFTVMPIKGVLCLSFLGILVSSAVLVSNVLCEGLGFVVQFSVIWLSLPSSLVLPLLYLHKARKLRCGQQGGG